MSRYKFPEDVLTQHIAVLGKTGSGKTCTAKLLVEQAYDADARVCVIDPIKSDWWGITSSKTGKQAGLKFQILGGPHGHVPIHADAGQPIAGLVAKGALPHCIIDMKKFKPGGRTKFFAEFAEVLLDKMKGVLYFVIEEAHWFAPKERTGGSMKQSENMSIHWMKMLALAGRSEGIRLVVNTQRTQSLHNSVLGSCDTLIAHRMTAPADQAPVQKWLAANVDGDTAGEVARSLPRLKTGEGWICAGEAQVFEKRQFPMIRTFDNTATPTAGGKTTDVKTAAVDEDKLRQIIGKVVEEAEAQDPKLMQQEITRLKKELKKKPKTAPAEVETKTVVQADPAAVERAVNARDKHWRGVVAQRDKEWEKQLKDAQRINKTTVGKLQQIGRIAQVNGEAAFVISKPDAVAAPPAVKTPKAAVTKPVHRTREPAVTYADGEFKPNGTQQRVLDAIAWWNSVGVESPIADRVGYIAGIKTGVGHWQNTVGPLRTQGLIEKTDDGTMTLTPEGVLFANSPDEHVDLDGYHEALRESIRRNKKIKGNRTLDAFNEFVSCAGAPLSNDELGNRLGITPGVGHFQNTVGPLVTMGLIERRGGVNYPTELLFPEEL